MEKTGSVIECDVLMLPRRLQASWRIVVILPAAVFAGVEVMVAEEAATCCWDSIQIIYKRK
jgi:hypothetical protein